MANTIPQNISLGSLDPNTLKSQMISWFQNQSIFRDYNFTGSNINVLLDIFSRNTFLNSFFLNMAFSESFNDSAQLKDSLVSISKMLNYVPYSVSSSTTSLNLTMSAPSLNILEIPQGSIFGGLNSNGSFSFVTDQNYIATSSNGFFQFSNVNIYEGYYKTDLFVVDTTVNNQLFTLSSPGIDTSSLSILVSENSGSTNTSFTQASNLYGLNGNSKVYFLQAGFGNTYQLQFGDGILGYIPQNGAVVSANYRVSKGSDANYISSFIMNTNLSTFNGGTVSNVYILTSNNSSGGANAEGIDSIRYNNPRHYQTQDNAITSLNYETLIYENFPSITDINVYGGGITNTAVQYGMIFIALVGQSGNPATLSLKNDIQTYINKVNILNYQIQFVDPDNLYLNVFSNVHVNFSNTGYSPSQYQALVTNTISNFTNNNLQAFSTPFRYSQFCDAIDETDPSIISNETYVTMSKYANVIFNVNNSIVVNFNNPISNVSSSQFIISGNNYFLTDTLVNNNPTGFIYLSQLSPNNSIINPKNVGTVNYVNGNINIPILNISSFVSNASGLLLTAFPQNKDIYSIGNDIIEINMVNGLSINISNN
jgi:hypothetical protein